MNSGPDIFIDGRAIDFKTSKDLFIGIDHAGPDGDKSVISVIDDSGYAVIIDEEYDDVRAFLEGHDRMLSEAQKAMVHAKLASELAIDIKDWIGSSPTNPIKFEPREYTYKKRAEILARRAKHKANRKHRRK